MTMKKDLKTLIRARCEKTGESYASARRHVLAAAITPPNKDAQAQALCPACGGPMRWRTKREMAELTDDATEGQMADHMAAEESGDWGEWAMDVEEAFCPRCEGPSPDLRP